MNTVAKVGLLAGCLMLAGATLALAQEKKEKNRGKHFEPRGRRQQSPGSEAMAVEDGEVSEAY